MVKKRKLKDTRPLSGPVREKKDTGKACQEAALTEHPAANGRARYDGFLRMMREIDLLTR